MRVLLLNPPIHYYLGLEPIQLNPGLGLPLIAAVLKRAGHRAKVVDMEALGYYPRNVADLLDSLTSPPDVIGITCQYFSSKGCADTVAAIKRLGYRGRIVVGGVYAYLHPEHVLSWGVDTVVRGECEGNIVDILSSSQSGIVDGQPLADLKDLPMPAWDDYLPSWNTYFGNAPRIARPEALVMLSRGCPHRCIFCARTTFSRQRQRFRPVDNVFEEISWFKEHGARSLMIYDDELPGSHVPLSWLREFSERIGSLSLPWKCQGRCSKQRVTPEVMRLLRDAGCRAVMWGVESFSQKVLDALHKDTTVEDIWHSLEVSAEAGLQNFVLTMIGNYQETEDDIVCTLENLKRGYERGLIQFRQTTVCSPMDGSELEEICKQEGWFKPIPCDGPILQYAYMDTPWVRAQRINYWLQVFEQECPSNLHKTIPIT